MRKQDCKPEVGQLSVGGGQVSSQWSVEYSPDLPDEQLTTTDSAASFVLKEARKQFFFYKHTISIC